MCLTKYVLLNIHTWSQSNNVYCILEGVKLFEKFEQTVFINCSQPDKTETSNKYLCVYVMNTRLQIIHSE